jgi:TrmH family RNA methyltransferase
MRSLRLAKFRDKFDCFLLEGQKLLREALEADAQVLDCFLEESLRDKIEGTHLAERLIEKGFDFAWATEKVMLSASTLETPPLAVAAIRKKTSTLDDLLAASPELIVVGEEIQDPGNVGAIIRTCSAAGFPAVVLCGAGADFYNPKVVRAAAGAILHCLLVRHSDAIAVVRKIKKAGYKIVVTAAEAGEEWFRVPLTDRTALLLGNEGRGVQNETLALADTLIHIPMRPLAESLNVATCCAILLYEAVRQRRGKVS